MVPCPDTPLCKAKAWLSACRSGCDGNRLGKILAAPAAPGCWRRVAGAEVRAELQRECAFSSALPTPLPAFPPKSRMTPACRSLAAAATRRVGSPSAAASGALRLGTRPRLIPSPIQPPAATSTLGGCEEKGLVHDGGDPDFWVLPRSRRGSSVRLCEPAFLPVSGRCWKRELVKIARYLFSGDYKFG